MNDHQHFSEARALLEVRRGHDWFFAARRHVEAIQDLAYREIGRERLWASAAAYLEQVQKRMTLCQCFLSPEGIDELVAQWRIVESVSREHSKAVFVLTAYPATLRKKELHRAVLVINPDAEHPSVSCRPLKCTLREGQGTFRIECFCISSGKGAGNAVARISMGMEGPSVEWGGVSRYCPFDDAEEAVACAVELHFAQQRAGGVA